MPWLATESPNATGDPSATVAGCGRTRARTREAGLDVEHALGRGRRRGRAGGADAHPEGVAPRPRGAGVPRQDVLDGFAVLEQDRALAEERNLSPVDLLHGGAGDTLYGTARVGDSDRDRRGRARGIDPTRSESIEAVSPSLARTGMARVARLLSLDASARRSEASSLTATVWDPTDAAVHGNESHVPEPEGTAAAATVVSSTVRARRVRDADRHVALPRVERADVANPDEELRRPPDSRERGDSADVGRLHHQVGEGVLGDGHGHGFGIGARELGAGSVARATRWFSPGRSATSGTTKRPATGANRSRSPAARSASCPPTQS